MSNLPKPPVIRAGLNEKESIDIINNYLQTLVTALEKSLGGAGGNSNAENQNSISSIAKTNDGNIAVRFDNGDVQSLSMLGVKSISYTNGELGIVLSNGNTSTIPVAKQEILWSGARWMHVEEHTITLPKNVTAYPNGLIFVFSKYAGGGQPDYKDTQSFFIPKTIEAEDSGNLYSFPLVSIEEKKFGTKELWIAGNQIVGNSNNSYQNSSFANGFAFDNQYWVLKYVIGV